MTKRDDPQHVRHTLRTKQVLILEQDEATRESCTASSSRSGTRY